MGMLVTLYQHWNIRTRPAGGSPAARAICASRNAMCMRALGDMTLWAHCRHYGEPIDRKVELGFSTSGRGGWMVMMLRSTSAAPRIEGRIRV